MADWGSNTGWEMPEAPVGTYYRNWFVRWMPQMFFIPLLTGSVLFFYLLFSTKHILYIFPLTFCAYFTLIFLESIELLFWRIRIERDAVAELMLMQQTRIPFDAVDAVGVGKDEKYCVVYSGNKAIMIAHHGNRNKKRIIEYLVTRFADRLEPVRAGCLLKRQGNGDGDDKRE